MQTRKATIQDKAAVLKILDDFRADCMEQITGEQCESTSARDGGSKVYEALISREDYAVFVLETPEAEVVGIITGYLCPMLRNGGNRAEVEEFFLQKAHRGGGNAIKLMDAFFDWCKEKKVAKVNLESENGLDRAHSFYKKYGFETKAQRFIKKLS